MFVGLMSVPAKRSLLRVIVAWVLSAMGINEMVRRRVDYNVAVYEGGSSMQIASIGIDLGKTTFHLVALGERSKVLFRKKFSRSQLLAHTATLPHSLIGLEAREHLCGRQTAPTGTGAADSGAVCKALPQVQ